MAKPPEPPAEIRLTTACIISGQYYAAGETLPFQSESELPPNLQGLTATGDEEFYSHSESLIYGQRGRNLAGRLFSSKPVGVRNGDRRGK